MADSAAKAVSTCSTEQECGQGEAQSRNTRSALNWNELLLPRNGGPGESPGRSLAIERARARTKARYEAGGFKRAKGTAKSKPKATVNRDQVRKAGW